MRANREQVIIARRSGNSPDAVFAFHARHRTPEDIGMALLAQPPRAVLFDMDGTLIDTLEDITHGVNAVLADEGRPAVDVASVRAWVGDGVGMLLTRALTAAGVSAGDRMQDVTALFRRDYAAHCLDATAPYPGIPALLDSLHGAGIQLGLVTNKPIGLAEQILYGLGWQDLFPVRFGGDSFTTRKPAPEPLLAALQALGVNSADAIMVGDSPVDMQAAAAAGIVGVGVSWGYQSVDALTQAGAHTIIHAPADLPLLWS